MASFAIVRIYLNNFLDECDITRKIEEVGIHLITVDDKAFWENVINNICNSSKTDNTVMTWRLYKGARKVTQTQTLKNFEATGAEYFQRNFIDSYICFPPCHFIEDEDVKTIAGFLEKVLKERYIGKKRVILVGPDIAYHAQLVSNLKGKQKRSNERCLMLFIEELLLVLVVRMATNPENIKTQLVNCQNNVLHLTEMHGYKLKDQKDGITICTIISCSTIEREELKNVLPYQFTDRDSNLYKTLFICKDDLCSTETFTKWWDESLAELQNRLDIPCEPTSSDFFFNMIGQHMVSMATVKEGLPTLSSKTVDQLDTVILTAEQFHCINSPSKKKLITGPFGSGKTLVGQRIVKKLFGMLTELNEKSYMFYITCDDYSIIDLHMERCMKDFSSDKVKIICGSLHQLWREHVDDLFKSVSIFFFFFNLRKERFFNRYKQVS